MMHKFSLLVNVPFPSSMTKLSLAQRESSVKIEQSCLRLSLVIFICVCIWYHSQVFLDIAHGSIYSADQCLCCLCNSAD